jgi:hypothetical protein
MSLFGGGGGTSAAPYVPAPRHSPPIPPRLTPTSSPSLAAPFPLGARQPRRRARARAQRRRAYLVNSQLLEAEEDCLERRNPRRRLRLLRSLARHPHPHPHREEGCLVRRRRRQGRRNRLSLSAEEEEEAAGCLARVRHHQQQQHQDWEEEVCLDPSLSSSSREEEVDFSDPRRPGRQGLGLGCLGEEPHRRRRGQGECGRDR